MSSQTCSIPKMSYKLLPVLKLQYHCWGGSSFSDEGGVGGGGPR